MHRGETAEQFIKYTLVGIVTCSVTYAGFLVLYRAIGIHYAVASGLGYCGGMASSFLVNRVLTFQARGAMLPMLRKFALVTGMGISVNVIVLHFFITTLRLSPEMAQVFAMLSAGCCNFAGNKLWTFRPVPVGLNT